MIVYSSSQYGNTIELKYAHDRPTELDLVQMITLLQRVQEDLRVEVIKQKKARSALGSI